MQVLYLGRAPRTKETLPDFLKWRRVTRPPLVFRGLTGSQRTPGFWGVTPSLTPSHMHTSCMKNLHFQNKRFLFYISTPWIVSEKSFYSKVMSFVDNELFGVSPQASYTFRYFRELSPLDAYVLPRIQVLHLRGVYPFLLLPDT